jgi:hypothetical protein
VAEASVAWLLVTVGTTLVVVDLVLASSLGLRSTLVQLHLLRRFPRISLGFSTVLLCALGVAVIAEGMRILSYS